MKNSFIVYQFCVKNRCFEGGCNEQYENMLKACDELYTPMQRFNVREIAVMIWQATYNKDYTFDEIYDYLRASLDKGEALFIVRGECPTLEIAIEHADNYVNNLINY